MSAHGGGRSAQGGEKVLQGALHLRVRGARLLRRLGADGKVKLVDLRAHPPVHGTSAPEAWLEGHARLRLQKVRYMMRHTYDNADATRRADAQRNIHVTLKGSSGVMFRTHVIFDLGL